MKLLPFLALIAVHTAALAPDHPSPWRGLGLTIQPVSEVTAIREGQPFYTGLFIHHDKGHHTYWESPGRAGVATHLEWNLPDGWKAGEIEWPAPDKVMMASIGTHGYERDVLLMVKITPPAKVAGKSVTLKTKAVWMCCGTSCNPGFHEFQITLPVAAGTETAWNKDWHKTFEKERANFPVALTGWKLSAVRSGGTIALTGEPVEKDTTLPEQAMFFSADLPPGENKFFIDSDLPQKWTTRSGGFRAELPVSEWLPKDQSVLRGVITGKKAWLPNDKRAALVEVPVKPEVAGK